MNAPVPTERRFHLRRVYLGVPHGIYAALFCTRSPYFGRVVASEGYRA